ncbi:MAG: lipid-A-disaccharide synthase N-terminal domain-containing protein [Pseudolabrys sp.]
MLVDITHAVGGYLHDVFVGNLDWGILIGYVAQIMFAMRFVVQWIASERAGRSVVPTAFWIFSIGGGFMLLGYAIYRKDPVFIIGQAFGVFVYLRNLQFVHAQRRRRGHLGSFAASVAANPMHLRPV